MTDLTLNTKIEDNFRIFKDKYLELFADIESGLQRLGSANSKYLTRLTDIISSLKSDNYQNARENLVNPEFTQLVEEDFTNNLKLNADITTLRIRMANLNLLKIDTSHYL